MRSLNLLVLRCRDIGAARGFYTCFGMTFEQHAHGEGPRHHAHEDDTGVFELYPVADGADPDSAGLGFASIDLDAVAAQLAALGHEPGPITEHPWGRTFVVRDPDGRRVEVQAG